MDPCGNTGRQPERQSATCTISRSRQGTWKTGGSETPEKAKENTARRTNSGNKAGWKIVGTHWTQREALAPEKHDNQEETLTECGYTKDPSEGGKNAAGEYRTLLKKHRRRARRISFPRSFLQKPTATHLPSEEKGKDEDSSSVKSGTKRAESGLNGAEPKCVMCV